MRKLGVVGCAVALTLGLAAACAGDDEVKKVNESAGAAGVAPGDGGSSTTPGTGEAGMGGTPRAADGGAGANGGGTANAGAGGESKPGEGGESNAGAGGLAMGGAETTAGGSGACPAQPDTVALSCAELLPDWKPQWDDDGGKLKLDVGSSAHAIVSGNVDYAFTPAGGGGYCGNLGWTVNGSQLTASPVLPTTAGGLMRIVGIHLVDECGTSYDFDPGSAPTCTDLRATGGAAATWDFSCSTQTQVSCPEQCS